MKSIVKFFYISRVEYAIYLLWIYAWIVLSIAAHYKEMFS